MRIKIGSVSGKSNAGFVLLIVITFLSFAYAASLASSGSPPAIISAFVEPVKVRPGDSMIVSAQISDPSGVSSVSADMGGIEAIPLSLASGTIYNGTWSVSWRAHDTLAKSYNPTGTKIAHNHG